MTLVYEFKSFHLTVSGLKRWDKHLVVPGNGAFDRGLGYLRAMEPIIFRTADFLYQRLPGIYWSYRQHANGALYLQPMNIDAYHAIDEDGNQRTISDEAAGMAWSLSSFHLLGRSQRGLARSAFLGKFYELQEVITENDEAEDIFAVFYDCNWDSHNV